MIGRVLLLSLLGAVSTSASRERINFDFGWRHMLSTETCTDSHSGINIGDGGTMTTVDTSGECCALCTSTAGCGCWDWNTVSHECWTKTNCSSQVPNGERVSGRAQSAPHEPPEADAGFDDSQWQLISTPHDMLIEQPYNQSANMKQAYLFRGKGWYRKHFKLPSDWQQGSAVWLYIEGSFHETTVWLNGQPLAYHQAGYTSWWIRIDNATGLSSAANVLAIFVDASTGTGWWYEGGGLMRHNWLVRTDPVHISPDTAWAFSSNITKHIRGTSAVFNAECAVSNTGDSAQQLVLRATVQDPKGRPVGHASAHTVSVAAGAEAVLSVAAAVQEVALWSVTAPTVYTVLLEILDSKGQVLDSVSVPAGVRTVRFDADKGLLLNSQRVKVRGFCDHSNFGGLGGAVPDRVNLFRAQALRAVGANAWRMAHNPPVPARLDIMDRLGMLALDENRDYGGSKGQGGETTETKQDELNDMRDLVKRDRSHPSVFAWSFCNEVGCSNESYAEAFRAVSKLWDPTRAVTQNHLGTAVSTDFLDVQGLSHKSSDVFESFHKANPTKPLMATECCSCMSQRGVDQDWCPNPKDGGCVHGPNVTAGTFYNNNIGMCTSQQVVESDVPEYVTGTFVWSGFDYLGEARGWPQNTKCRGTVADVAGFTKETAYWLKSWWLSNISSSDAGKPPVHAPATTLFILERWAPVPGRSDRTINVYSNAPMVRLELNGAVVAKAVRIPKYGMATFDAIKYVPGNLTAVALDDDSTTVLRSYSVLTPSTVAGIVLTLDAPSALTGTGSSLLLDCQDTAMLRATLVDSTGRMVQGDSHNVTFSVLSGPGRVSATHNGDPANTSPSHSEWTPSYYGLARAFVQTTADYSTAPALRERVLEVDVESSELCTVAPAQAAAAPSVIVVHAAAAGFEATVSIPVSADPADSPVNVAQRSVSF